MPRPQTIVAATDFSEGAERAVRQAAYLARAWGATLSLVHVFNDSLWASIKAAYEFSGPAAAETASRRLAGLAERIGQEFSVPVEAEVLAGHASRRIADIAIARNAGLLVVGEHGEDWVSDVVLGGTALKAIEATRIPVLLVRRTEPASYRHVVIATDFSAVAERAAHLALDCFPDAHHALIHAWLVPFEASMRMGGAQDEDIERYREREFSSAADKLEAFARSCRTESIDPELLALHGAPAEVLLGQARARGSDLMVIGKHGGQYIDELLLGSVTQNILYHAECDVLLTP